MGTITKTIGSSGRDYSTITAWRNALPANLTTDGNAQVGQCYNDSEFTEGSNVTFDQVTDATNNITLTTASGQSFRDNASVRSNALNYNQTNGAAVHVSGSLGLTISTQYMTVSNLQVKGDNYCMYQTTGSNIQYNNCIFWSNGTSNTIRGEANLSMRNCIIYGGATGNILLYEYFGTSAYFCSFVGPSDLHTPDYLYDDS